MPVKLAPQVRPQPTDYAAYYEKYVSLVPGTDILGVLEAQRMLTTQLLAARSEREGNFRYAADKWTVKELVGHIADSERIFAYRALRIARADKTPIEGFEQDDYVKYGGFNDRTLVDLAEEFAQVRGATLARTRMRSLCGRSPTLSPGMNFIIAVSSKRNIFPPSPAPRLAALPQHKKYQR